MKTAELEYFSANIGMLEDIPRHNQLIGNESADAADSTHHYFEQKANVEAVKMNKITRLNEAKERNKTSISSVSSSCVWPLPPTVADYYLKHNNKTNNKPNSTVTNTSSLLLSLNARDDKSYEDLKSATQPTTPILVEENISEKLWLNEIGYNKYELLSKVMTFHEIHRKRFETHKSSEDTVVMICPFEGCKFKCKINWCFKRGKI
jgi:hypothetical protein